MVKKLLASSCLVLSIVANAAIINFGTVTRTTAAGLDCLDVTESRGLRNNHESAQFGVGYAAEGDLYATMVELDQLITSFEYPDSNANCDFNALHHDIGAQQSATEHYDVALMPGTETVFRDSGAWGRGFSELAWAANSTHSPVSSPGYGESFLVATTPVSMPVVGWFLSALIWWVRCAYRAKHRLTN